jgi:N-acetylglucosaminyldiphosphoundecaprenol N-acetyl-beta-D-mannosaminyltransferase
VNALDDRPPATPGPRTLGPSDIMGVAFRPVDEAAAVDAVFRAIANDEGGWLLTVNVDVLRQISASAALRKLVSGATLVVADGMPLVWASAIIGHRLPERVTGSTLIYSLTGEAARRDASVFLVGGAPGTAAEAAAILVRRCPGLRVAGTYCPPLGFESDSAQLEEIADLIRRAQPNLVFVGLSCPKQERLVAALRPVARSAYFVGVGVSFSFVAGDLVRAPLWLQGAGLEWLHRLVHEPRHLFKRYIVHDVPFAVRLFSWAAGVRMRKPSQA